MFAEQFVEFVRVQPFRPYRIRLADGRYHDIEHPDFAVIIGTDSIIVGVHPKARKKGSPEKEILVAMSQITQVEFLDV